MMNLLPYLVVLGTSVWVLIDARKLGIAKRGGRGFFHMGPVGWFLSCVLLWIVAFPAYLLARRAYLRTPAPSSAAAVPPRELDLISQLAALADLHSQGLLTDEEFQAKKKVLVRGMQDQ